MHLYVEGIDLSGKSSAVADFVTQSEETWKVQHGQLGPDSQLYSFATEGFSKYSLDVVGDLLSAAIRADLDVYTSPETPTIQDSLFTVRSLAFFTTLQHKRLIRVFDDLLRSQPTFDQSFVFTASAEARESRLQQRMAERPHELSALDKALVESPTLAAGVNKNIVGLTQEAFGAILIDTTELSIRAAGDLMRKTIGDRT